jgi:hypothetical protein
MGMLQALPYSLPHALAKVFHLFHFWRLVDLKGFDIFIYDIEHFGNLLVPNQVTHKVIDLR